MRLRTLALFSALGLIGGGGHLCAQTASGLTIRTADGSAIRGTFADTVVVFVSTLGRSRIVTKTIVRYDAGTLTLTDQTVLKGKFEAPTLRFRTGAGVLAISTGQLVGVEAGTPAQTATPSAGSRTVTQSAPSAVAPWPSAYGWYVRGQDGVSTLAQVSVETILGLSLRPDDGFAVDGIRGNPTYRVPLGTLQFIAYQQGLTASTVKLSRMVYLTNLQAGALNDSPMSPEIFRSVFRKNPTDLINVGLWQASEDIPLTIEPVRDHPDMFQFTPARSLGPGRYALYEGGMLHPFGTYFAINRPRTASAHYFLVGDLPTVAARSPIDSIVADVPDNSAFDDIVQDFASPSVPVWLAITKVLADKKDIVIASNKQPPVVITEGVHGGLFKNLDRYYFWVETVNPTLTRVHMKLMRYVRDVDKGTFTLPEERSRTRKAAQDFLTDVVKALPEATRNASSVEGMQAGVAAFQAKDYVKARNAFQALVDKEPRNHDALYNLANTQLALNDGNNLVTTSRALLGIDPLGINNYKLLASAYKTLKDSVNLNKVVAQAAPIGTTVAIGQFSARSDGATLTGTATGVDAKDEVGHVIPPHAITLIFDFMDAAGTAVVSRETTIPALPVGGNKPFTVDVRGAGIASWRYRVK